MQAALSGATCRTGSATMVLVGPRLVFFCPFGQLARLFVPL